MAANSIKCVIVVAADLPLGLIANATAILGVSLGAASPGLIGAASIDQSGQSHSGLLNVPLPILQASANELSILRNNALETSDVQVFDFTEVARQARTYEDYLKRTNELQTESIRYVALALHGPTAFINKLTGQLKLLR